MRDDSILYQINVELQMKILDPQPFSVFNVEIVEVNQNQEGSLKILICKGLYELDNVNVFVSIPQSD